MLHRTLPTALVALAACSLAEAQFVVSSEIDLFGVDDVEITPDGRFAVARPNELPTSVLVYDLVNGGPAVRHQENTIQLRSGVAEDAVALTNERAIVLGNPTYVLDLTTSGAPILMTHELGEFPRDVALTPDGAFAVVRGGNGFTTDDGLFVIDMATGMQVASAPGQPEVFFSIDQTSFDVDSAVATDRYGIVTSLIENSTQRETRVTVWDLRPAGGGAPTIAFETTAGSDLSGVPNDLALAPSGDFVAVRSEFEVGMIDLSGAAPSLTWTRPLFNMPGPLGFSVMDSIEVTDSRIATLSRWSNGGIGAQVDVFDLSGAQYFQLLFGDPHDLAITPSGERLVARTSTQVILYDLVNLPSTGNDLTALAFEPMGSTHTSFGAGLDSIVASDECVVACARVNETATVRTYDISDDRLDLRYDDVMMARPIDVDLSEDGQTAWISGFTQVQSIDLRTMALTLDFDPGSGGGYPWCDGVVVGEDHVVAFGYRDNPLAGSVLLPNSGWLTIIDTFNQPQTFCTPTANSTGGESQIFATGSASTASNDLTLSASDLPSSMFGRFLFGDTSVTPVALGDGFQCVGGTVFGFPAVQTSSEGIVSQIIDLNSLPSGAQFPAGTTWNFQFIHRDSSPVGPTVNLSPALEVQFVN